jgi:hypothetical protein
MSPADRPSSSMLQHRLRDVREWGNFGGLEAQMIETTCVLDASQARALCGSMATVLRRSPDERTAILDEIESMTNRAFGGSIERRFVTARYTGATALNAASSCREPDGSRAGAQRSINSFLG